MKFLFTILLLLITGCYNISAQEIKGWRVKAGTNIATQKWSRSEVAEITYKSGQFYEIGREIKIKPYLSFVPNLAYQEMGFGSLTLIPGVVTGIGVNAPVYDSFINHFRYLTLQAALKLQLPNGKCKPYLIAGYQGGILLSSDLDFGSSFSTTFQRRRHYDDGPVLSLGFEMNTSKDFIPFLEFSHYRSVRNVLKSDNMYTTDPDTGISEPYKGIDVRNRVYTIGGGIKF